MSLEIGITEASDTLTQSVEIEKTLSEVVRRNKDGGMGASYAYDPMISGTITVLGTTSDAVGSDLSTGLSSVSGGVTIVTEKTYSRTNDNFDETQIAFMNAPGAS
jgi:formylmethanofuran dehydrogenase subunit C